ncbi:MAG: hypothetical protein ACFFDN_08715, partial [Candidatus Hodarchaeota archaeon]
MREKKCNICRTPLSSEDLVCPICKVRFVSKEEMKDFKGGIFSRAGEQIDIPLDFWNNNSLVFEVDFKLYLKPNQTIDKKSKDIDKIFDKLTSDYKVQKTRQFEQTDYWYLLKFFFIKSQFIRADPTGIALLIGGVPSQLKIQCNCGTILDHDHWLRGVLIPPSGMPSGIPHEYYLRISEKCEECGKIICIYRPKSGLYNALLMFLSFVPSLKTLFPKSTFNFDITKDEGFLVHWVTIIDELLQEDPESICSHFYEDILKVWKLMETHKGLSRDHKEEMKKLFPLNDFVDQYKDLFRHKGTTLLAFLSRGIIIILSNLMKNPDQKIEHLFNILIVLYNEIGSWIYGINDPKYIHYPLRAFIDQNDSIKLEQFSKTQAFLNWIAEDLLMVLEESNIPDPRGMNPRSFELEKAKTEGQTFMWRSGEMFAMALEVINRLKVPMDDDSIDTLSDMFNAFGSWIYGDQDFKEIVNT